MHPKITCKLKSGKIKDFQDSFIPKLMVVLFLSQKFTHGGKSVQFAAKAVLMNRQKNLMVFNFTIFPSNLKQEKDFPSNLKQEKM